MLDYLYSWEADEKLQVTTQNTTALYSMLSFNRKAKIGVVVRGNEFVSSTSRFD